MNFIGLGVIIARLHRHGTMSYADCQDTCTCGVSCYYDAPESFLMICSAEGVGHR